MSGTRTAIIEATAAAAPLAIVYFSGWAFLSAYLGNFDIDATQVDISLATVLVYAFVPLKSGWVLGTIAALCVAYLLAIFVPAAVKPASRAAPVLVVVATILLLFIVRSSAGAEADTMAALVWKGQKSFTNVSVKKPDNPDKGFDEYVRCRDTRRLRQIIGTTDTMFLLCRNEYLPCWHATMFAIKSDGTITYWAERRREDSGDMASCK